MDPIGTDRVACEFAHSIVGLIDARVQIQNILWDDDSSSIFSLLNLAIDIFIIV